MSQLRRRIEAVVEREKIDLIHSHSPSLNGLPAWRLARKMRIPFVYEARAFWEDAAVDHGTFEEGTFRYRLSRAVEGALFRNADKVIVIAQGMVEDLVHRGISRERVLVVPNGVNVDEFQPVEQDLTLKVRLGLADALVFGFIGSFYHYEGLRFLVEAFAQIVKKIPNAKLLLVGGGPEEPSIRKAIDATGASIHFVGHVPHDQVANYYSIVDVLVYPRRRMRLTELVTPLKPLEAMAMGKTIVASDVGGHKELIDDEKTGLLFKADDESSLISQMLKVSCDAELRQKLGRKARCHVVQTRTWEKIIPTYLGLYEELLRRKSDRN